MECIIPWTIADPGALFPYALPYSLHLTRIKVFSLEHHRHISCGLQTVRPIQLSLPTIAASSIGLKSLANRSTKSAHLLILERIEGANNWDSR